MAEPNSIAPACPPAGTPTAGVLHVRTRLTAHFTVLANALAQRRGSAVTVGVATYILSLPDGAPVSIAALCEHFTEGEILISRALRELESAGYLERRRERGPGGRVHTRTFAYDVPGQGELRTPGRPRPSRPQSTPAPAQEVARARPPEPEPDEPAAVPEAHEAPEQQAPDHQPADHQLPDPQAVVILASLRIADPRLVLSRREVDQLAPGVTSWLTQGMSPEQITESLTARLPDRFRSRPARILGYRLAEPPVALPPAFVPVPAPAPELFPWQTCEGGCERAFRAPEPGRCRDCPPEHEPAHRPMELAATG
ncbi:hypothetical protein [Streptomyces sp. NPDC088725]|uniref:hypothetical protein n=1 Tax=Streptomyces sp. NPDC088725 TaxID=3365873 RepID=UPI00381FD010